MQERECPPLGRRVRCISTSDQRLAQIAHVTMAQTGSHETHVTIIHESCQEGGHQTVVAKVPNVHLVLGNPPLAPYRVEQQLPELTRSLLRVSFSAELADHLISPAHLKVE
jgi:hypothetical protein